MALCQNLKGMRTYLVGAMDRVPDGGVKWRERITPYLEHLGVTVLNPCKKPIHSIKEDEKSRNLINYYKQTEQYDKIRINYSSIRNADLRCVDISDFIVCYIDINIHMCGSYEEIVTANRQKKPILIWCEQGKQNIPNWLFFMLPHEHMFSSMIAMVEYLQYVHESSKAHNLKRWFFY